MISDELVKESTKLEKYLLKHKDAEFIRDLRVANLEQLKKRIQEQAIYEQQTITAKSEDEKLHDAKSIVKELQSPYNDSIRMNKKISRFISLLMGELV